jgi:hypothetical protein
MPDKQNLPPLPPEAFDGEKYSVEIKTEKCKHEVYMEDGELRCKKCPAGWRGPSLQRLYEAFKKQGQTSN